MIHVRLHPVGILVRLPCVERVSLLRNMEIQRERFVLGDPFLVLAQILLGIIDLLWVNDELQPGGQ